ncbi:Fatty-acid-binding protein 3 [Abeliophyllum distichum]|uniref:Chalcone-flavonone isomerase family protein n=1 Tax=Abeliophyllum distichum TaxID=126358 RepID=A0ABD1QND5_9LAMI
MTSTVAICTPICHSSPTKSNASDINPRLCFIVKTPKNPSALNCKEIISHLFTFPTHVSLHRNARLYTPFSPKAASSSSVGSTEYIEEPETKVKFQKSLSLPGCSSSLSLLGTGYREKVFAIIGVKVYAAGLYANISIFSKLDAWKGHSAADVQRDSSLFDTIFQAPLEKSLHIILVRDVDGKTFWDALDEAVSSRIKSPTPVDERALSTFSSIFQGRALKKGTSIFLTWLDPTKMLVCVSSDGLPSSVDATIESLNVTSALFHVFLGGNPVSPSLKSSVANGLAVALL